ncbi:MAG: hypothetical protein V3T90_02575 [Anaerolineae bacterium]
MEKKRGRLALVLMTWVLLLVLAFGALAPGAFAREAGLQAGFGVTCALDHGGSGT